MATKYTPKSEYAKKLLDPRWQRLRLEVLNRDKFTCQCCGATDKTLHAHHLFYWPNPEGPWEYDPSSILTVCEDCHEIEHQWIRHRDAVVLASITSAGFRNNFEMECFSDIMTTLARAVTDPEAESDFLHMIQCHLKDMRARGSS